MTDRTDSLRELIEVMATLRSPNGCPWDRQQTHQSLTPYMIEEAYEAIEAIENGDLDELKKELGDVLLQVLFHSRIEEEAGNWDIYDVAAANVAKLKSRHPHIYGETAVSGSDEVLRNWEEIKRHERKQDGRKSMLDGVPKHLPALRKAKRVQEKVARVGFDWENIREVEEKVSEELAEFREACESDDRDRIEDELGDVFFALVNLARYLDVDPEDSLRRTVDKFIRRFQYIERELDAQGRSPSESNLAEMDALWDRAKSNESDT